jgi:hypothetical protein
VLIMHIPPTRFFILFIIFTSLLFSCVSQRKSNSAKKELATVDSILVNQKNNLKELDEKIKVKEERNEIDETSRTRINTYITKTETEIDKLHKENLLRIGDAVVNRADFEQLIKTLSFSRNSSKIMGDKLRFLNDLVNQNLVVKIDQDVVFESGKYVISVENANTITRLFEPAAIAIDNFTKKYPEFPLSLVITAKGYADASVIVSGTNLYRDLKDRLKLSGAEPDNKALNKELSNARAEQVINLFKKFAAQKASNQIYLKNVLYLYEGKGDALPDKKVNDYRPEDPRRRVVYLFWSIFPE